jgi:hypothetical protein
MADHECNAFLPQVLFKGFMNPFIQYLKYRSVSRWNEVNFNANLLQLEWRLRTGSSSSSSLSSTRKLAGMSLSSAIMKKMNNYNNIHTA